jgi:trk system potassium uptake protein TrkH
LTVSLIGAIPFLGLGIGITDAVFESVSGITTTGSTILTGLDSQPPGILMWRALLQWLGGIGIIATAILMLPLLRVGGMQLFKIESSDTGEKAASSTMKIAVGLLTAYVALTAACTMFYYAFGMSGFDAVTHAMATLSTGGFSTHDASFGYFTDRRLHWTATLFMLAGAVPFFLYIRAARGDLLAPLRDPQVRTFISFVIIAAVVMAAWLMVKRGIGISEALTLSSFNIVSIVTTTGFASEDYTAWGRGAIGFFLVLMFVGGCTGSTSGAIKIYRFQVAWLVVRAHLRRLYSPNRVVTLRYNDKRLPDDVPPSVLAFLTVFVATIALFTICFTFTGLDLVTAYSAAITAITNVGPGLGEVIGPAGTFEPLPDTVKWLLSLAMLAGRLEVMTLLIAFDPDFWRY